MHTPLHGIARQGVPGTSYSISYDVMKITLDLPVIVHNNPPPPPPPPPPLAGEWGHSTKFLIREALSARFPSFREENSIKHN